MAEIGYAITEKLIEVLARSTINDICKLWKYESELNNLKQTVSTIQKVFLDADAKWDQLNNQDRDFISKLKDVVYDAEDVFDEFHTRSMLNQIEKKTKVRMFFRQVRGIFSFDKNKNHVKHIKERLDAIVSDRKSLELIVDYNPIVRRPKETCSYIDAGKIIGRDKDKESVIKILLDPDVKVVTIVGMGGLGKTALAQLVFNDEKIKQEFSYSFWVCVSDQEGENFDSKAILCKILELVTSERVDSTLQSVLTQFQENLKGKKYFLVLDDVWNEDRMKWVELEEFLGLGREGSKMIVTTRSKQTAISIDYKHAYMLDGLPQEDSQCLFELSAFGEGKMKGEFVQIGERILDKCYRNPLAIKVIGSLLFNQDLSKWVSIEKSGLAEISGCGDKIMRILKLSYHKLTPSLKCCFSYCAIFPKDFRINKEMVISLWMAQEFIVPLDGGQSVEDAAEEYFLILMRRCFFQDIEKDDYDNVISFKIHDLMHDVAQEIGKDEICVVTSKVRSLGERVRHVNNDVNSGVNMLLCSGKIRLCIFRGREKCLMNKQVKNLKFLRALDLYCSGVNTNFPRLVDSLLLLRYLNLSDNKLEQVPDSITRLYNLQTLILDCVNLMKLPKDFSELVNLRQFDVGKCWKLTYMPEGMDQLTKLRVLPYFVAGGNSDNELKVLQILTEIKGDMCIMVRNNYRNVSGSSDKGGGYLKSMKHLTKLKLDFDMEGESEVLKKLEPPHNLKVLKLCYYKGTIIPWFTFSPQSHRFVHIHINNCPYLKQIPVLSRFPHLKSLQLLRLNSLEYMEEMSSSTDGVEEFFPSLEYLKLEEMEKLQGWWKGNCSGIKLRFPCLSKLQISTCLKFTSFSPCASPQYLPEHELPSLRELEICQCPSLASNFTCPNLEFLFLENINKRVLITCLNSQEEAVKLGDVKINKVKYLNSLLTNCLTQLAIGMDRKAESFKEVEDALQRSAATFRKLNIHYCMNMSRLSGLEHLTALEELVLFGNLKLSICEDDDQPWKSLHQTLRKLVFSVLPEMKCLPSGMQHLTSLQSLKLCDLKNLERGLPEWMTCFSSLRSLEIENCLNIQSFPEAIKGLTSLNKLSIVNCPDLKERCKKPNGEDYLKIQHIPEIEIYPPFDDDDDDSDRAIEEKYLQWNY